MFFSQEQVEQLQVDYETITDKYTRLLSAYAYYRYNGDVAYEHGVHGFARRLKVLKRCIDNIFQEMPPDLNRLPSNEELVDAHINLQAYIFNVFGTVDNLAWFWVSERNLTTPAGNPLPKEWIGLRRQNVLVRDSFSPEFRAVLDGFNEWFELNENYRHAVAHRIPLYIPPYMITPENEAAHDALEDQKNDAFNRGEFDEYDRLSADQEALGTFRPIMTHSFLERARGVIFHSQMLIDFNTIDALGWGILAELNHE